MKICVAVLSIALGAFGSWATPSFGAQATPAAEKVEAALDICAAFMASPDPAAFSRSATGAGFAVHGVRAEWAEGPKRVAVEYFHLPPNSLCTITLAPQTASVASLTEQVDAWMGMNGFMAQPAAAQPGRTIHLYGAVVDYTRHWTVEVASRPSESLVTFANLGL